MSFLNIFRSRDSVLNTSNSSSTEKIQMVTILSAIRNSSAAALLSVIASLTSGCAQTVNTPCPPSPCPTPDAGSDESPHKRSKKSKRLRSDLWVPLSESNRYAPLDPTKRKRKSRKGDLWMPLTQSDRYVPLSQSDRYVPLDPPKQPGKRKKSKSKRKRKKGGEGKLWERL